MADGSSGREYGEGPEFREASVGCASYGLEAIKRLRNGRSIVFAEDGVRIKEFPGGRHEMALDEQYRPVIVSELPPAPR